MIDCRSSKFEVGMAQVRQTSAAETKARRMSRDMAFEEERARAEVPVAEIGSDSNWDSVLVSMSCASATSEWGDSSRVYREHTRQRKWLLKSSGGLQKRTSTLIVAGARMCDAPCVTTFPQI